MTNTPTKPDANRPNTTNPHSPHKHASWIGILALLACATLWSLNGPLIKLLNEGRQGVPGITIACYRSLIGGLCFLPFTWRRLPTLKNANPGWPAASVILFTIMTVSFVIATTQTAAANAIVLQYTSAIWVFALSPWLLREKPGRTEGLVLLLAMAGIAVIFFGQAATDATGLSVALASGFGYGTLTIALRGLRAANPAAVAATNALGSGLLLLIPVAIWGRFTLTPYESALMLAISLIQFTLPYVLFSWALQRVEAHRAALIVLLETVLNPLLTYLIVGEPVPRPTLLGGPLIIAGVAGWVLLTWRRHRALAAVPTDAQRNTS